MTVTMVWPWGQGHRELRHKTEMERKALREDLKQLESAKRHRSMVHSILGGLSYRRDENHISDGLEELYRRRRGE